MIKIDALQTALAKYIYILIGQFTKEQICGKRFKNNDKSLIRIHSYMNVLERKFIKFWSYRVFFVRYRRTYVLDNNFKGKKYLNTPEYY